MATISRVAESIAGQMGVDRFYGDLLPQDKVAAVEKLASERGQVTMVGDGINDTPASGAGFGGHRYGRGRQRAGDWKQRTSS